MNLKGCRYYIGFVFLKVIRKQIIIFIHKLKNVNKIVKSIFSYLMTHFCFVQNNTSGSRQCAPKASVEHIEWCNTWCKYLQLHSSYKISLRLVYEKAGFSKSETIVKVYKLFLIMKIHFHTMLDSRRQKETLCWEKFHKFIMI